MTTVTKTEGNALRRETEGGNDRRPKTQSDSNTGKLEKWKEEDKVGVRIGEKEAAPTHRTVHPVALQVQRGGVRDPLSLEEEREPPHSQETAHTNHLFRPNHDNQEKKLPSKRKKHFAKHHIIHKQKPFRQHVDSNSSRSVGWLCFKDLVKGDLEDDNYSPLRCGGMWRSGGPELSLNRLCSMSEILSLYSTSLYKCTNIRVQKQP